MPRFTSKTVSQLSGSGAGIFIDEGTVVIIPGALPGDVVSGFWNPPKAGGRFGLAESFEIVSSSPLREERCPVSGRCGGCPAGRITYEAELRLKTEDLVESALKSVRSELGDVEVRRPIGQKPEFMTRFRNKAVFYPFSEDGRLKWGYYEARTHNVVEAVDCPLNPEWMGRVLKSLPWNLELHPVYDENTRSGCIRAAVLKDGEDSRLAAFVVKSFDEAIGLAESLAHWAEENGITSVVLHENPKPGNGVLSFDAAASRTTAGNPTITARICGLSFKVGVETFMQVNAPQTPVLYKTAVDALGIKPGEDVWDLYCGVGTISLMMAAAGANVVGVDRVEGSIACARENALANGLSDRARFIAGLVEDVLPGLESSPKKAIVDPAFKGLDSTVPAVLGRVLDELVYISCNPKTFVRDALLLKKEGLDLEWVQPVDMFPGAWHLELVGRFVRRRAQV